MIAAVLGGLAGFWVWVVLNDPDGLFGAVRRRADKTAWSSKWLSCPWCSGAWFAIVGFFAVHQSISAEAVVSAIAAAAVTGILGTSLGEQ